MASADATFPVASLAAPGKRFLVPVRTAAAIVFLIAGGALAGSDALLRVPLVCSFRAATGVPCVGCGGTHAFERAAHGDFAGAARLNLLGAWAGLAAWLLAAVSCHALLTGRGRPLGLLVLAVTTLSPVLLVWSAVRWWAALPAGFVFPHSLS